MWPKKEKLTEEHKRKIGLANKGKKHSLETRQRLSDNEITDVRVIRLRGIDKMKTGAIRYGKCIRYLV
jgi:hypothetical protein